MDLGLNLSESVRRDKWLLYHTLFQTKTKAQYLYLQRYITEFHEYKVLLIL